MSIIKVSVKSPKIFVSSCESSGDFIAGKLIAQLRSIYPNADIRGMGGEFQLFDNSVLSIMGFWEVLLKLPKILWLMHKVRKYICEFKPDIVITIDSWGFHYRLAKKVREDFGNNIKLCHYVAPMVWVYGAHRAELAAKVFDHMLVILPFEKPYFDAVNLPCTYVGHPFTERAFAKRDARARSVLIMPGSRWQEIKMLAPIFLDAITLAPTAQYVIPTFEKYESYVRKIFAGCDNVKIVVSEEEKKTAFSSAACAIVKSGTSAVEMLLQDIPIAVVYKTNFINAFIIKRKARISNICLINILAKEDVVKELVQDECTAENIALEIEALLDSEYSEKMISKYAEIKAMLRSTGNTPSKKAAEAVESLLHERSR